nr:DUF5335 family protein [uncultured Noviherbaspirillum sp.]
MTASRLDEPQGHLYVEKVSGTLGGKRVDIEVDSLATSPPNRKKWLTLLGAFNDPESVALMIACVSQDHLIREPADVRADEAKQVLVSIEIVHADALPHRLDRHQFHGSGRR